MYTRRIQLINYGPIDELDITFPFDGDKPKPVLLVDANGSGKSILLSHIVNGFLLAQKVAHPETPEVKRDKVYKLRSPTYIRAGSDFSFSRVDFDRGLNVAELQLIKRRQDYESAPDSLGDIGADHLWNSLEESEASKFWPQLDESVVRDVLFRSCVLYFPSDRGEDPAWLNVENLQAQAQHMRRTHLVGYTDRKIINYSSLRDNENWLFDVVYDFSAFERQTQQFGFPVEGPDKSMRTVPLPVFLGFSGRSKSVYDIALRIVQTIIRGSNVRFGIGARGNRAVSIMENEKQRTPNIFQLSSGEVSLLNIFLSILRDFDLCDTPFTQPDEVRGVVVVDEIDLHLHADHQYDVLPRLIQMFPGVQFILTTHSPLLVLGLQERLGETGLGLYRLPQGQKIEAEGFTEFGTAYHHFTKTNRFITDLKEAVNQVQRPLLFVDGGTDVRYIKRAIELLGWHGRIHDIEIRAAGGDSYLKHAWKVLTRVTVVNQPVVLLHDCDGAAVPADSDNVFRRRVSRIEGHPISKGIENLFSRETLARAKEHKAAFIDVTAEHCVTKRGQDELIPEEWATNEDEKGNLCEWLCQNGTAEDFRGFSRILDEIQTIPGITRLEEPNDDMEDAVHEQE